jgi:hypothetical protein
MLRSLAIALVAAFAMTAGSALADPGYTRATTPTANLFNRTAYTVKLEFRENGAVKRTMVLYKGNSIYPVDLQGIYAMTGTVDVGGKNVTITERKGVDLKLGQSLNISVGASGSGFIFRNGT